MDEPPVRLPSAPRVELVPNIVLQPPLSRRGHGPGLIIIAPTSYAAYEENNETLDPEPLQKWAEEGYAVVRTTFDVDSSKDSAVVKGAMQGAVIALVVLRECDDKDNLGLLVYGSRADYAPEFNRIFLDVLDSNDKISAIVMHDLWEVPFPKPFLCHLMRHLFCPAEQIPQGKFYSYPDVSSPGFIVPGHPEFKISSARLAHTRTLTFLKQLLNGPYFDMEKIWEEHTHYEFGDRSVAKTMGTMVQEPYVNHVPTITGGIGRMSLSNFYRDHFIFSNPDDTAMELISRTIGIDRIVDEFIFTLTHDKEIDWLAPGIPPTGKPLRIPFTSIVNIRGDRLYHEHIAWDQATVLVQLGLMPEYLPFPYPLPGGQLPSPGKRFEFRVPAAGVETAAKLKDERAVPSNEMLGFQVREVDER